MTYFDLVRHYGLPFQSGQANSQLGVPLALVGILDVSGDLNLSRNSVDEIYTQIINDLNDAISLLPVSNDEFADRFAATALLARVYLQQQNYAMAAAMANEVIANSGHSLAPTFAEAFNNDTDGVEDVFTFQVTNQTGTNSLITFYADQPNGGRGGDITINDEYVNLFDSPATDVRAAFFYISANNGQRLTSKYTNQFGNFR